MKKRNLIIIALILAVSAVGWKMFEEKEQEKILEAEVQKIVSWSKDVIKGRPIYVFHIGTNDSSLSLQAYTQESEGLVWDSTVSSSWLDRASSTIKWRLVDFNEGTDRPKYNVFANGTDLIEGTRLKKEHISELSDRLSSDPKTKVLLSNVKDLKLNFDAAKTGILLMELSVEKDGVVVTESFNLTKRFNPKAWESGQRATETGIQ